MVPGQLRRAGRYPLGRRRPWKLEVYGFASWHAGKGLRVLRNPDDSPAYSPGYRKAFELPADACRQFFLRSPGLKTLPSAPCSARWASQSHFRSARSRSPSSRRPQPAHREGSAHFVLWTEPTFPICRELESDLASHGQSFCQGTLTCELGQDDAPRAEPISRAGKMGNLPARRSGKMTAKATASASCDRRDQSRRRNCGESRRTAISPCPG